MSMGIDASEGSYVWTLGNGERVTLSFASPPLTPPAVVTVAAGDIGPGSATLNATVNARGRATSVTFEYGETTSYGDIASAVLHPDDGEAPVPVSVQISNLSPNTSYHFRVRAMNSDGTSFGEDETFTTSPALASGQLPWPLSNGYAHPLESHAAQTVIAVSEGQFFDPEYGTDPGDPSTYGRDHVGIDFSTNRMSGVPVYAIDDGEILDYRDPGDGSDVVFVRHRTGSGTAFIAVYGHCQILPEWAHEGAGIEKGEQIGIVPTGMTGPHLHLGINRNENVDDFWGLDLDGNQDASFGWGKVPIDTDRELVRDHLGWYPPITQPIHDLTGFLNEPANRNGIPNQPDNAIGPTPAAAMGKGVINLTGKSQTLSETSRKGRPVIGFLLVRNAGESADRFRVAGTKGDRFFRLLYRDRDGNATAAMERGNYTTVELPSGIGTEQIRVVVSPENEKPARRRPSRQVRLRRSITIRGVASSVTEPTRKDVAVMKVQAK